MVPIGGFLLGNGGSFRHHRILACIPIFLLPCLINDLRMMLFLSVLLCFTHNNLIPSCSASRMVQTAHHFSQCLKHTLVFSFKICFDHIRKATMRRAYLILCPIFRMYTWVSTYMTCTTFDILFGPFACRMLHSHMCTIPTCRPFAHVDHSHMQTIRTCACIRNF